MTDQEIKNQINSAKEELRKEIQELKRPRKPEPILKHNHSGGDYARIKHSDLIISLEAGTEKTTPTTVDGWIKIVVNGTIYYLPAYTSKTT